MNDVADLIALGNELEDGGQTHEALDCYLRAIEIDPLHAPSWINAGIAQSSLNQRKSAQQSFRTAIQITDHPAAHLNLANLLIDDSDYLQAEEHYLRALSLRPDWKEARFGLLCVAHGRKDASLLQGLRQFLDDHPDDVQATLMLAEATTATDVRRGMEILSSLPENIAAVHAQRAKSLTYCFDHAAARRELRKALQLDRSNAGYLMSYAFGSMSDPMADPYALPSEIQACLAPVHRSPQSEPHRPNNPYRIGYLSGDYRAHPVANFLFPVVKHHNRGRFHVVCLANVRDPDLITASFREHTDEWFDLHDLDDDTAAEALRALNLDAVIDFSGWTERHRIGLLQRRIAPIQATAFAVYLTTGVPEVDFRICDSSSDPPGMTETMHSEQLFRIEGPQACYHEFRRIPCSHQQPLDSNGYFKFGYFNQASKISLSMLDAWSQILVKAPDSRLVVIGVDHQSSRQLLSEHLFSNGVRPEQLEVFGRLGVNEYAQALTNVDLALDSFPWNGGTTTIETLLAGVPVLTLSGQRPSSRSSRVFLDPLGLSDWAHVTVDSWVQTAINTARNPTLQMQLRRLRAELPEMVRSSVLMDPTNYIKRWENALLNIIGANRKTHAT